MEVLVQRKWVKSASELQTCLETNLDSCAKCQGRSKSKPTCGNSISQASRTQVSSVLIEIVNSGSISSAAKHLERLASLVLCKRFHQYQVTEKVTEWGSRLSSFLGLERTKVKEEKRPGLGIPSPSTATRSTKPARCASRASVSTPKTEIDASDYVLNKFKKENSPVKEEDDKEGIRLDSIPFAKYSPRKTASFTEKDQKPTIHEFLPFSRPKRVSTINKAIMKKLSAAFLESEKEKDTGGEGYIYGYRLPEHHTMLGGENCPMIKIGFTNNPERRMKQWQAKCQYEPVIVFMYKVTHYVKMEKIIHRHLSNERRKEVCAGCGSTHHEFFEVETATAEAVVRMWAAWARLRPFDEEGVLTPYWSRKLKELDLDNPDCWDLFVFDKVK